MVNLRKLPKELDSIYNLIEINPEDSTAEEIYMALFCLSCFEGTSIRPSDTSDFIKYYAYRVGILLEYLRNECSLVKIDEQTYVSIIICIRNIAKMALVTSGNPIAEMAFQNILGADQFSTENISRLPNARYGFTFTPIYYPFIYYVQNIFSHTEVDIDCLIKWIVHYSISEFNLGRNNSYFQDLHDSNDFDPSQIRPKTIKRLVVTLDQKLLSYSTFRNQSIPYLIFCFLYEKISTKEISYSINESSFWNTVVSSNFSDKHNFEKIVTIASCYISSKTKLDPSILKNMTPRILSLMRLRGITSVFQEADKSILEELSPENYVAYYAIMSTFNEFRRDFETFLFESPKKYRKAAQLLRGAPLLLPKSKEEIIKWAESGHAGACVEVARLLKQKEKLTLSPTSKFHHFLREYVSETDPVELIDPVIDAGTLGALFRDYEKNCISPDTAAVISTIVASASEATDADCAVQRAAFPMRKVKLTMEMVVGALKDPPRTAMALVAPFIADKEILCDTALNINTTPEIATVIMKHIPAPVFKKVQRRHMIAAVQSGDISGLRARLTAPSFVAAVEELVRLERFPEAVQIMTDHHAAVAPIALDALPDEAAQRILREVIGWDLFEVPQKLVAAMLTKESLHEAVFSIIGEDVARGAKNSFMIYRRVARKVDSAAAVLRSAHLPEQCTQNAAALVQYALSLLDFHIPPPRITPVDRASPSFPEDAAPPPKAADPGAAEHRCTFYESGRDYMHQPYFHCHTCGLVGNQGCCVPCAEVCHRGHEIEYHRPSSFYCDCFDSPHCRLREDRPAPESPPQEPTADARAGEILREMQINGEIPEEVMTRFGIGHRFERPGGFSGTWRMRVSPTGRGTPSNGITNGGFPSAGTFDRAQNGGLTGANGNGSGTGTGRGAETRREGRGAVASRAPDRRWGTYNGVFSTGGSTGRFGSSFGGRTTAHRSSGTYTGFLQGNTMGGEQPKDYRMAFSKSDVWSMTPPEPEVLIRLMKEASRAKIIGVDAGGSPFEGNFRAIKEKADYVQMYLEQIDWLFFVPIKPSLMWSRPPQQIQMQMLASTSKAIFAATGNNVYAILGKKQVKKVDVSPSSPFALIEHPTDPSIVASISSSDLYVLELKDRLQILHRVEIIQESDTQNIIVAAFWTGYPMEFAIGLPNGIKVYSLSEDTFSPRFMIQPPPEVSVTSGCVIPIDGSPHIATAFDDGSVYLMATESLTGPVDPGSPVLKMDNEPRISYNEGLDLVFVSVTDELLIGRPADLVNGSMHSVKGRIPRFSIACFDRSNPARMILRDDFSGVFAELQSDKIRMTSLSRICGAVYNDKAGFVVLSAKGKMCQLELGIKPEKRREPQPKTGEPPIEKPPSFWGNASLAAQGSYSLRVACGTDYMIDRHFTLSESRRTIHIRMTDPSLVCVGFLITLGTRRPDGVIVDGHLTPFDNHSMENYTVALEERSIGPRKKHSLCFVVNDYSLVERIEPFVIPASAADIKDPVPFALESHSLDDFEGPPRHARTLLGAAAEFAACALPTDADVSSLLPMAYGDGEIARAAAFAVSKCGVPAEKRERAIAEAAEEGKCGESMWRDIALGGTKVPVSAWKHGNTFHAAVAALQHK